MAPAEVAKGAESGRRRVRQVALKQKQKVAATLASAKADMTKELLLGEANEANWIWPDLLTWTRPAPRASSHPTIYFGKTINTPPPKERGLRYCFSIISRTPIQFHIESKHPSVPGN